MLPAVEAALSSGELALHRLTEGARVRRCSLDTARAVSGLEEPFLNVNTPQELARAAAALARGVTE
jgi:molybdopterin-guanine dinucleotide biosynthesis protein A